MKRLALALLGVAGLVGALSRCGSVTVSNLDPANFPSDECVGQPRAFSANALPVFASKGCDASACHDSTTASGGLSLDAADGEDAVYAAATGSSRVDTTTPADSLLLQKPLGSGGHDINFASITDADYLTLFCWIESGAPNN